MLIEPRLSESIASTSMALCPLPGVTHRTAQRPFRHSMESENSVVSSPRRSARSSASAASRDVSKFMIHDGIVPLDVEVGGQALPTLSG
jgi:hypothetical protein